MPIAGSAGKRVQSRRSWGSGKRRRKPAAGCPAAGEGVSQNVGGDVSDDEAAWHDLIARLTSAAADDGLPPPWPARENLTAPPASAVPGDPVMGPLTSPRMPPVPDREGVPDPGTGPLPETGSGGPDRPDGHAAAQGTTRDGLSRARIVRPAFPGFLPPDPAAADSDDHYVPPPPPPLPALDPVAKGAWVALFGGPGYLLLAVMAGWQVPGWAAFCAVAAFIGGFVTLVVRMGDQPPRDSGPDSGAVV